MDEISPALFRTLLVAFYLLRIVSKADADGAVASHHDRTGIDTVSAIVWLSVYSWNADI